MKNRLTILTLLAAFTFFMSCSDDDNPVGPNGPDNELAIVRSAFQRSSEPVHVQQTGAIRGSKILWHGLRNPIPVTDIWDSSTASGEGAIRPFRIISRPDSMRVDTQLQIIDTAFVLDFDTTYYSCRVYDIGSGSCADWEVTTDPQDADSVFVDTTTDTLRDTLIASVDSVAAPSWNGITACIENYNFTYNDSLVLEIRMRGDRGLLHFDLGMISEDTDGDGVNDTEDLNQNGAIEQAEDVGLDGLADMNEPSYNGAVNPDPHGDNWYFDGHGECPLPQIQQSQCDVPSNYYEWLNGTEGNSEDPAMQGNPDEEKMGPTFNSINAYLSVLLDLSDTSSAQSLYVPGSIYPAPGSNPTNGYWQTWRIPLSGDRIGWVSPASPSQINLTHFRVWIQHLPFGATVDTVTVAQWRVVHVDEL